MNHPAIISGEITDTRRFLAAHRAAGGFIADCWGCQENAELPGDYVSCVENLSSRLPMLETMLREASSSLPAEAL
jgi:hypothetical protein